MLPGPGQQSQIRNLRKTDVNMLALSRIVAKNSVGSKLAFMTGQGQNEAIRKISPDRVVTTLAGLAGSPGSADGIGSDARFNYPCGITVDNATNLYVAIDRKVSHSERLLSIPSIRSTLRATHP